MKNITHYSNITFTALLASTIIWGWFHKNLGIEGILIIATCWVVTRILHDGLFSLIHLITQEDDEEKD